MRQVGTVVLLLAVGLTTADPAALPDPEEGHPDIVLFFQAASSDEKLARAALKEIEDDWRDGYTPMFIDLARMMRPPSAARPAGVVGDPVQGLPGRIDDASTDPMMFDDVPGAGPRRGGSPVRRRLLQFLKKRTGQKFGQDLDGWRRWMWSLPYRPHPDYAFFKAGVYRNIDPRMSEFLYPDRPAEIRLDEIDWGGVRVNGVPPLDHPRAIAAGRAGWLKDDHIVFGIEIDGAPRAYPKRIVGWHELVRDSLGGTDLALVYCTMCGSVIPYEARAGDEALTFGTSGLLYRSNKLMFDEETMTLWSALYGKPVVGPRVGSGVRLKRFPIVTTTWGEWRAMHPDTTVLSRDTGFDKDYAENAAYRNYESTDRIWFAVPELDKRLRNKADVETLERQGRALAVSGAFLRRQPVYHHTLAGEDLVFLTSAGGATRVYAARGVTFEDWSGRTAVRDTRGAEWRVDEDGLVSADGVRLTRVASSRAYWFGWYAQYPETELVK